MLNVDNFKIKYKKIDNIHVAQRPATWGSIVTCVSFTSPLWVFGFKNSTNNLNKYQIS